MKTNYESSRTPEAKETIVRIARYASKNMMRTKVKMSSVKSLSISQSGTPARDAGPGSVINLSDPRPPDLGPDKS